MELEGIEPSFPGCKPGVLPLDDSPVKSLASQSRSSLFRLLFVCVAVAAGLEPAGRRRTRLTAAPATSYGLRHNRSFKTSKHSSRGWSRTSGLRVQSATFVPSQTTRDQNTSCVAPPRLTASRPLSTAPPRFERGRPGSEPGGLPLPDGAIRDSPVPDAGIEPATRAWHARVMPLHQPGFHSFADSPAAAHTQYWNRTSDSSL